MFLCYRYMYTLLTALPWVGRELFEKKENDLERIMAAMESYLRRRNTAHVAALRVWNCDTPHPQVSLPIREYTNNIVVQTLCLDVFRKNIWNVFGHKCVNCAQMNGKKDISIDHT